MLLLSSLKILWGDQEFFMQQFSDVFEDRERAILWGWTFDFLASFLLFACFPILIRALWSSIIPPLGLGLGDRRFGLIASGIAILLLPLPAWIASMDSAHRALYPLSGLATASAASFLLWNLFHLLHYIGWEIFYRGFIGMGMRPLLGAFGAMSLQVLLTTLMHIDKANGETLGAIVAGIYLGLLTYRTGSIWYAVFFHAYAGALNSYFCA